MEGPQGNTYQFYDGVNRWALISYLERIETLSILHSCGGLLAFQSKNRPIVLAEFCLNGKSRGKHISCNSTQFISWDLGWYILCYALLKFNNLLEERITRAPRGADQPIDTPYFGSDQKSDCISWHNCRSDKSALHNPG